MHGWRGIRTTCVMVEMSLCSSVWCWIGPTGRLSRRREGNSRSFPIWKPLRPSMILSGGVAQGEPNSWGLHPEVTGCETRGRGATTTMVRQLAHATLSGRLNIVKAGTVLDHLFRGLGTEGDFVKDSRHRAAVFFCVPGQTCKNKLSCPAAWVAFETLVTAIWKMWPTTPQSRARGHGIQILGRTKSQKCPKAGCLMDRGETDASAHVWLIYLAKGVG